MVYYAPENCSPMQMSRSTFLADETQEWAKNIGRKLNNVAGPSVSRCRGEKKGRTLTPSQRRVEPASSPKKRIKSSKTPRKKRRVAPNEDKEEESEGDESDLTTAEEQEDDESEEINDEDQAEAQVLGRGGRRGAKVRINCVFGLHQLILAQTKAKKAVTKRRKAKQEVKSEGTADEESDLTDQDDD